MDAPAWCEEDRILAEALQIDEDERCKGCGQYLDESTDDDMDGWYEAETVTCHGCAARDRHTKEQKEPEPGELVWVRNTYTGESITDAARD